MPSSADPHAPAGKVTAGSADPPANGETVTEVTTPVGDGDTATEVTTPVGDGDTVTEVTTPVGDGDTATEVTTPPDAAPSGNGASPTAGATAIERPPGDRVMRRLLRVHGPPIPGAVFGAQGFMSRSIAVSAVRCTITYLLVPILTPIVGVLNAVDAPLSIALLTFALVMSVRSLRRFWLADHAKRWAYTGLIAVVWVLLAVGLGTDVARLV